MDIIFWSEWTRIDLPWTGLVYIYLFQRFVPSYWHKKQSFVYLRAPFVTEGKIDLKQLITCDLKISQYK